MTRQTADSKNYVSDTLPRYENCRHYSASVRCRACQADRQLVLTSCTSTDMRLAAELQVKTYHSAAQECFVTCSKQDIQVSRAAAQATHRRFWHRDRPSLCTDPGLRVGLEGRCLAIVTAPVRATGSVPAGRALRAGTPVVLTRRDRRLHLHERAALAGQAHQVRGLALAQALVGLTLLQRVVAAGLCGTGWHTRHRRRHRR